MKNGAESIFIRKNPLKGMSEPSSDEKKKLSPLDVEVKQKVVMPLMSDLVFLTFGIDRMIIGLPRFIAREYPTVRDILKEEPDIERIDFMKDEKLTEVKEEGVNLLFALRYVPVCYNEDPTHTIPQELAPIIANPEIIISAIRWAQYMGLNFTRPDVFILLNHLARMVDLPANIKEEIMNLRRENKFVQQWDFEGLTEEEMEEAFRGR
jgi:hypothetical protein